MVVLIFLGGGGRGGRGEIKINHEHCNCWRVDANLEQKLLFPHFDFICCDIASSYNSIVFHDVK